MNRPLTDSMKKILMDAYNGNCVSSANKTQLKGLASRNYLNNEFNITEEGERYIISNLSLVLQCEKLSLPIQVLEWDKSKKPEIWAWQYFSNLGFVGAYCEGGAIGLVLKGLCLDELTKTSYFYGTCINAREDACLKGINVLAEKNEDQLNSIMKEIYETDRSKYLSACEEILSYPAINEWYPGLNMNFLEKMYDALTKDEYCLIAKWIAMNPEHRNGWPDLTLVKENIVCFVEVKTTDKLHNSQLNTIPAIKQLINADIQVIKLTSNHPKSNGSIQRGVKC
ncbi:MAG: hypothetical protein Q8R58_01485 [Sulfuricurvum sp.]|nr:hypothetical protein [Sulfuricurvum sp.]